MFMNRPTCHVIVIWSIRIRNPFAGKHVAFMVVVVDDDDFVLRVVHRRDSGGGCGGSMGGGGGGRVSMKRVVERYNCEDDEC